MQKKVKLIQRQVLGRGQHLSKRFDVTCNKKNTLITGSWLVPGWMKHEFAYDKSSLGWLSLWIH